MLMFATFFIAIAEETSFLEKFMEFLMSHFAGISGLCVISGVLIAYITEKITRKKEKAAIVLSFSQTVDSLSSQKQESQLSAAILLRRYFDIKPIFAKPFMHDETINVIASLLRTLPTGIYQKTLADGLAYAKGSGLTQMDLQKANLQNAYIGHKQRRLQCQVTDFFSADLSFALLENVDAQNAVFCDAIFLNASIKGSDMSCADFRRANLTHAYFKQTRLYHANFSGAVGIPDEILAKLDENGIYQDASSVTTKQAKMRGQIFFSMPGVMSKNDELITMAYKDILEKAGYAVIYYKKDDYPRFGQLNNVCSNIKKCTGVIAFGFKQLQINSAIYHPMTNYEEPYDGKWHSTPWSEIEVGMSIACGLPILLVHDDAITQGIFDEVLNENFMGRLSSHIDVREISKKSVFNEWLKKTGFPLTPKEEVTALTNAAPSRPGKL